MSVDVLANAKKVAKPELKLTNRKTMVKIDEDKLLRPGLLSGSWMALGFFVM